MTHGCLANPCFAFCSQNMGWLTWMWKRFCPIKYQAFYTHCFNLADAFQSLRYVNFLTTDPFNCLGFLSTWSAGVASLTCPFWPASRWRTSAGCVWFLQCSVWGHYRRRPPRCSARHCCMYTKRYGNILFTFTHYPSLGLWVFHHPPHSPAQVDGEHWQRHQVLPDHVVEDRHHVVGGDRPEGQTQYAVGSHVGHERLLSLTESQHLTFDSDAAYLEGRMAPVSQSPPWWGGCCWSKTHSVIRSRLLSLSPSFSLFQLYLHGVTRQIPRHAASAVRDGKSPVAPFEGGRMRRVEFVVVVCRNACQCVRHPS